MAISPCNVGYAVGTSFLTLKTIPGRLCIVSITAASELSFIYRLIEEGHARSESWISSLRGNVEFAEKPMEILAEVLRR